MWAGRSKWPKPPTLVTPTPTRSRWSQDLPPQGEGGARVRRTHSHSPYPAPSATPSPQQHAPLPPNAPWGRKDREGPEETGQGERDEQGEGAGQGRPRSPKTVQSAEGGEGKDKRERIIADVRSPCQENNPADAHPSAHKSVLKLASHRTDSKCASGCTWSTARATARLPES